MDRCVSKDATQFHDYTSKIGWNLLDPPLINPISLNKWRGLLLDTHWNKPVIGWSPNFIITIINQNE